MEFTFYGHSSFKIQFDNHHIVFDPFISPNELANNIDVDSIKADHILISHGHQDHIEDALAIASKNDATIVSNFEIVTWFAGAHGHKKGHPMNHGGNWNFDFGKVKYVNAVHSSVLPDGSYGGNPGGFVVEAKNGKNFYFAGDTALTMDMKLIPLSTKLDFCILPIGDNFTMGIDDAVLASDFVECDIIIGVHYDTFGYIKIDKEKAKAKFLAKGKTLLLPEIGETITV